MESTTSEPTTPGNKRRRPRRGKLTAWLFVVVGVALLGFSGWNMWQRYRYLHRPAPAINTQHTVTFSTDKPAETPINCETYKVPADQPRRIVISSIGVDGCIQKVGIDQNNRVGVPQNVNLAGWYTKGARPGDPGVSLIDGHIQGYYNPGIFKKLSQVKTGDSITVWRGDDSKTTFTVTTVRNYSVDDAAGQMLAAQPGIASQLNLITCGGRYDAQTKQYEQRTLVTAKRN